MKFKTLSFFVFIFLSVQSFGQNRKLKMLIYAGPSVTNIHSLFYGERVFHVIPPRPYYELNFHVGAGVEFDINNYLDVRGLLNYERKGSAQDGFNKTNYTYGDFIQLPASLMVKPLKEKEIRFEFGVAINYLINTKDLSISAREFYTWELAGVLGFEFKLFNNFYFGTRLVEPFNDLSGNITSISGSSSPLTQKSQSFQFSILYKTK